MSKEPNNDNCDGDNCTADCSRVITVDGGRRSIGYALAPATNEEHRSIAIVYFYPLSSCSLVVNYWAPALAPYQCSVVCVDRPLCAQTTDLPAKRNDDGDNTGDDFALHRIAGYADDVMTVLRRENITKVYLLAACIGHPYAVEVARRILSHQQQDDDNNDTSRSNNHTKIQLNGLTLVAPFVSPACRDSWKIARLGACVPSFCLYGFTELAASGSQTFISMFLRPSTLKRLLTEDEQSEGGWVDTDLEETCTIALAMSKLTDKAKGIEARLGASRSWQVVCDRFSEEYVGLVKDDEATKSTTAVTGPKRDPVSFPIRIHASRQDKVAPFASVEWVARRCYGGTDTIIVEEGIHNHEVLTMFGGPARNPLLMHRIARDWGLL